MQLHPAVTTAPPVFSAVSQGSARVAWSCTATARCDGEQSGAQFTLNTWPKPAQPTAANGPCSHLETGGPVCQLETLIKSRIVNANPLGYGHFREAGD